MGPGLTKHALHIMRLLWQLSSSADVDVKAAFHCDNVNGALPCFNGKPIIVLSLCWGRF